MRTLLLAALAAALCACASYSGRGLVSGQATMQDVERVMGPAADQRPAPGGDTVRYYSRLPYGREIYAARFGPDGKLKSIEQRLTEQNFAKLVPGTTRAADVRDLLGPPNRVDQLPRMEREAWTYQVNGFTTDKLLFVQLSRDGIVREVIVIDDPNAIAKTHE
jgi:hypothetical protein